VKNIFNGWTYLLSALFIVLFLIAFFLQSVHYRFSADDIFFTEVTTGKGLSGAIEFFYSEQNGRLGAHILCCVLFMMGSKWAGIFILWQFVLLFCMLFSLNFLFRSIFQRASETKLRKWDQFLLSFLFVATCYISSSPANTDMWHWTAGTSVHTFSFILMILSAAYLLKHQHSYQLKHSLYSFVLLLIAGSFSEANLITMLAIIIVAGLYTFFIEKTFSFTLTAALLGLITALLINVLSPGIKVRLNQLPDFTFLQAVKNTVHTYWDLLKITYFKPIIILPLLFINSQLNRNNLIILKRNTKSVLIISLLTIGTFNIFISCFLLSDLAPMRSLLLPFYCLVGAIGLTVADTSKQ
jgi:Family of unknown function (DUF6056)